VPERWRNTTYWLAFDPQVKGLLWAHSALSTTCLAQDVAPEISNQVCGGVGISMDGGRHWTVSNAGMQETAVTHILSIPQARSANERYMPAGLESGVTNRRITGEPGS